MSDRQREGIALLALRLGLAWFLFVWAVNKFLSPGQYEKIWGFFYGIDIGSTAPYLMGGAQVLVCVCMALGYLRVVSYLAGFLMHLVTIIIIFPTLIAPFVIAANGYPTNRNASIAVAALAGFAALWLLRHRDHFSLDAYLANKKI